MKPCGSPQVKLVSSCSTITSSETCPLGRTDTNAVQCHRYPFLKDDPTDVGDLDTFLMHQVFGLAGIIYIQQQKNQCQFYIPVVIHTYKTVDALILAHTKNLCLICCGCLCICFNSVCRSSAEVIGVPPVFTIARISCVTSQFQFQSIAHLTWSYWKLNHVHGQNHPLGKE